MDVAYLEDYLDTMESLPLELTRSFTLIRELDASAYTTISKLERETRKFLDKASTMSPQERTQSLSTLTSLYKQNIQFGNDKVALALQTYDMVDRHIRRLDEDLARFEDEQMTGPKLIPTHLNVNMAPTASDMSTKSKASERRNEGSRASRRTQSQAGNPDTPQKRQRTGVSSYDLNESTTPTKVINGSSKSTTNNKKKERESGRASSVTSNSNVGVSMSRKPSSTAASVKEQQQQQLQQQLQQQPAFVADLEVDPNEPTYCICKRVSFGEMIACDNDDCPIEWFHYDCVGLTGPVKGKWFCPICSEKTKK